MMHALAEFVINSFTALGIGVFSLAIAMLVTGAWREDWQFK